MKIIAFSIPRSRVLSRCVTTASSTTCSFALLLAASNRYIALHHDSTWCEPPASCPLVLLQLLKPNTYTCSRAQQVLLRNFEVQVLSRLFPCAKKQKQTASTYVFWPAGFLFGVFDVVITGLSTSYHTKHKAVS